MARCQPEVLNYDADANVLTRKTRKATPSSP